MTDQQIEQEIQAKGLTAPRVTPADIEANIAAEHYFTAAEGLGGSCNGYKLLDKVNGTLDQVTFCVLVLRNGTKIVGINYGSVDPAQHSAADGRKYAREHAIEQIWPLLGYELRSNLRAMKAPAPGLQPIDTAPTDGTTFLAYRERDGRWGECYRVQRDDCEMWTFGGGSAAVEEWPDFTPTHWMPLPGTPK